MGSNARRKKLRLAVQERFKLRKGVKKVEKEYGQDISKLVKDKLQ